MCHSCSAQQQSFVLLTLDCRQSTIQALTSRMSSLSQRAAKVFPGGKYTRWPLQQLAYGPSFLKRGDGCRVWDAETGDEYIDFMCGFGASVLGYNHPEVEAAAAAQTRCGATLTGPTERSIELAERVVGLRPGAEWAIFGKNGTDATLSAKIAARAATGRTTILRESSQPAGHGNPHWAYHGAQQWLRGAPGVLSSESSSVEIGYVYNDLASVERALEQAAGDCAAIFAGGASYPYSALTEPPTAEFARGLRSLADKHGCMLVLDEIRTNFRVGKSVQGNHWTDLSELADASDVAPDMYCMCKAIANGHPIAALVGNAAARDGAAAITASGTFWLSGGPMSAALATLDVLAADNSAAMGHVQSMGRMLTAGLEEQAARHGVGVTTCGPDAMPFMTFDADAEQAVERPLGHRWCAAVADKGVWLHPHHNWYLSLSHSAEDIAQALDTTEAAFASLKQ